MTRTNKEDSFVDYLREIPNFLTPFIAPIYFMTVSPMFIEMSRETGISTGDLSLIITFFTIGIVSGQLTSVIFNKRFSKLGIIITGYMIIIGFLVLLSFTFNKIVFYSVYLLLGYTTGVVWIQSTRFILENRIKNKDRLTTIFLSFYPIGSMVAPLISTSLINNGIDWRYSYYVIAAMTMVIITLFLLLKRSRWDKQAAEEDNTPVKKIFFDRRINLIFILGCLLLFFYCISETVIAAWSPTFLRTVHDFDIQYAGLAVSVFWLSILLGRILISFVAGRVNTNYILLLLSVSAIVAMAIFIPLSSPVLSLIAVGFAGLGHSGIITLGVSSASTVYLKGRGILASIVFAAINSGASVAPFLTRSLSGINMTLSIILAPISMVITAGIIIWKMIYEKKTGAVKAYK